MEFKIPEKYSVGGQEIEVRFVDDGGSYLGCIDVPFGVMKIAKNSDDRPQSETSVLNTFMHELVHSILKTMGEEELNANEKFVNCFAGFLTEAIKTMENN